MKKKALTQFGILILLLVNGLSSIVSGLLFIKNPIGLSMGLHTSILKQRPFDTFLVPGIILVLFNGISSLFVLWKVARTSRDAGYWLILQGMFQWMDYCSVDYVEII
ncbi:MAG: hypothetical protein BGO31_12825 [Bacteroidetes bacterium 43-16]|nr:MAG: hypothetical protein BGO31_12825 [Bacteroidetes bacterium 43-16]